MKKPWILLYDLETTPSLGYTWGKYDQTVLRFVKHRELLSVAYQWLGRGPIRCETREGEKTDRRLAGFVRELFQKADIIIAHNGNQFDGKVAKARMAYHHLNPCKVLTQVDTRLAARNGFDFNGNSLSDLAGFFKFGGKIPVPGIDLWLRCMRDDKQAWRDMVRYNKHDVFLLRKVYLRLRPWLHTHPSIASIINPSVAIGECPVCGSKDTCKNGLRVAVSQVQQRWDCRGCGAKFLTRKVK